MDYLFVLVQGLVGAICFTMPGIALLSLWGRRKMPTLPFAFVLAAGFVLSSILIAGLEILALTFLNPIVSRVVTWAFVAVTLFHILRTGRKRAQAGWVQMTLWEGRSVALLVALVVFWLLTMPFSPYPSQTWLQLGDPPAYYHAAANLAAGKGWQPDYFVGDYLGGTQSYVTAQPILVLITAFLFQIFGTNWYSLYVYDAIAAGVLLYFLVTFVCWRPGATTIAGERVLFLTLVLALLPSHFLLFGLGVITAPGALAFLTIAFFCIAGAAPIMLRYFVIVSATLFLLWLRPETALLAILLIVCGGVLKMLAAPWISRVVRAILLVGFVVALVSLWANIPAVMDVLPSPLRGLGIFYVRLDVSNGQFVPMYNPPWEINRKLSQANFGGESATNDIENVSIGQELRAHPVAFLAFLIGQLPDTATLFVRAVSAADMTPLPGMLALGILLPLLVLSAIEAPNRPIVVVVIGFLLVLPILNPGAEVRHVLVVSPVVMGMVLRLVSRRWGEHWGERAGLSFSKRLVIAQIGMVALLVALDSLLLIRFRLAEPNQTYVRILNDIQGVTSPMDVIASSYPQLIACVTGRRGVGTTWLTENLELIIKNYEPEIVLVDNARDGPPNYTLLTEQSGLTISGYVPVVHNEAQRYIIFRRVRSSVRQTTY